MTTISQLSITACWVVFLIYWMVAALRRKPVAEEQSRLSSFAHRGPVLLGAVLLWNRKFPYPLDIVLIPRTDLAQACGAVVCLAGLVVAIWARRTLGGNWSSNVTFKQGHELVETGPYRYVRHPIYTGLLMMCVGTAVEGGQLHCWLGVAVLGVGFWIKLKREEALLLRHFPNEYPSYRSRVKALVPFLI